jgi:hypothetical protein
VASPLVPVASYRSPSGGALACALNLGAMARPGQERRLPADPNVEPNEEHYQARSNVHSRKRLTPNIVLIDLRRRKGNQGPLRAESEYLYVFCRNRVAEAAQLGRRAQLGANCVGTASESLS